jgi:hypothetical protein
VTDIAIPPEAVEVAAKELADTNGWRNEKGIYACRPVAEAILRAGIAAWPGMWHIKSVDFEDKIILPLPGETRGD